MPRPITLRHLGKLTRELSIEAVKICVTKGCWLIVCVCVQQAPSEKKSPSRSAEVFAVALSQEEQGSGTRQEGTTDEEEDLLRQDLVPRRTDCMMQPPDKHRGGGLSLTSSSLSSVLHSSHLMLASSGSGELPAWASITFEEKVDRPDASPKLDVSASGFFPGTILLHRSEHFGSAIRVSAVGKVEGVVLRGPGLRKQQEPSSMGAEMLDLLSPCRQGDEESAIMAGLGVSRGRSSRGASAAVTAPHQLLSGRIARGELWASTQAAFARDGDNEEAAEEGMPAAEELLSAALAPSSGNELLLGHKVDDESNRSPLRAAHSRPSSLALAILLRLQHPSSFAFLGRLLCCAQPGNF